MKCKNCGHKIDMDYLVENYIYEELEESTNKKEVKDFLDNEFDFSIDNACEKCWHTYWFEGKEKEIFYKKLKEYGDLFLEEINNT